MCRPAYFEGMKKGARPDRRRRRCADPARGRDKITTDQISPAGRDQADIAGGQYLWALGGPADFNPYGTRRGNHQIMCAALFANIRIKHLC